MKPLLLLSLLSVVGALAAQGSVEVSPHSCLDRESKESSAKLALVEQEVYQLMSRAGTR